ncbi:hypothetical protein [Pseudolactococcus insecticola]|uniref:Cystathionine beta-lyase n=1 Tax=Pseudolactococcus insecticola TaxID=2709158 RepID=A0A6A0B705_9LACT|nr:hypothetical protein [Lactococcus insecticola]GFH41209.1 hypothetical protein Hs20B_16070 [Lactococcus insecticola]
MDYVELAIKSGGFMAMDRVLLENRLATLTSHAEKLAYIMPPASVINAYFAEIYQKQGPEAATDYFLDLSTTFDNFTSQPSFALEGAQALPVFRFIRLNLSGKSYGFAFENASGIARVFSESDDEKITDELLFEIAQVFPHDVVSSDGETIKLEKIKFQPFSNPSELSILTTQTENDNYFKIATLNKEDGLKHYNQMINSGEAAEKMVQFKDREFLLYLRK